MSERVGVPLNEDAQVAKALRAAGVEVGSVGGDTFRRVVANRLLASSWLRAHDDRIRAEAWDEGYEAHDWTEINPYRHPGPALRVAAGTPTRHTTEEDT